jgi:hypothetical protein
MLSVAKQVDPCCGIMMFDQSSIESRAIAFGIQKSPIKTNNKSSKPRFSEIRKASQVPGDSLAPPDRLVAKGIETQRTLAPISCSPQDQFKIINGFCVQLDAAARCGQLDVIQMCIQGGADLNQKTIMSQQTPLHAALQTNQRDALALLVSKGADIYEVC